ncbi:DUF2493 domain-containing protein [Stakelama pacifica]|uniref:Uncharacterized protein DUF2493 n=1 Tax=Stakelama pacifica TaxID=517720 RepID=A0A4V3BTI1_9SPHN|nr:DUF2493 domain-containing protein [Stakelama pacifica]TDN83538.1 uncharacterized protein DUF2493 [Stakelama pacifica]GGO94110.1 hypothetical protein GCM10011329_15110 [Stakelama pacifica]
MTDHDEPEHEQSHIAHLLDELELYGRRPFEDEADPRPLPEARLVAGAAADTFDAMVAALSDTRLEPDLEDLLWGITNVFHRAGERLERELDDNEQEQRRLQRGLDGSEVRSVELETATAIGRTLLERRDAMEAFRDSFADQFQTHCRKPWVTRSGSLLNRKMLTASMIDSRDFIMARKRTDAELLMPAGTRIAITGGADYQDHRRVWDVLDRVLAKHPDMVLLHGGTPSGTEHIAACWARTRKVTAIVFRPDWAKHAKAAPFKRNDVMIEQLPAGVIHFPGTGISANLADKARKAGIPVWRFGAS